VRWLFLSLALVFEAAQSYPVLSADKNAPKTVKADEKKQQAADITLPATSAKTEISGPKKTDTQQEQIHRPFTDFFSWVWWLVIETISSAEKFFTFWVAIFTLVIAVFTFLIFWEAQGRCKKELRAYVSAVSFRESDGIIQLAVRVKNFGKTPAHGLFVRATVYTSLDGEKRVLEEIKKSEYDDSRTRLLHPGEEWDSFHGPLTDPISSTGFFLVIGRIIYRDIYDRYWEAVFNFYHQGIGNIQPWGEDTNYEKGPYKHAPF
jgi:hypothetical protein